MADPPFFPPPKPRQSYREAAPPATLPDEPVRRKPVVVSRPPTDANAAPTTEGARALVRDERGFWAKQNFAVRHPRLVGTFVFAMGVWLIHGAVNVLLHGGVYSTRTVIGGPFGLTMGLFLITFGCPLDPETGRP